MKKNPSLVTLGGDSQGGSYLLRIHLQKNIHLKFGGFKRGKTIPLSAGEYIYIGSALSEKGAASLAPRLIRHATRSGRKRPHKIRSQMLRLFHTPGLNLLPKQKKLHWNVDHLLDLPAAEFTAAYIIRSPKHLEKQLGQFLEQDPHTLVFEKGLGANDVPGNTHILRVEADETWWQTLPDRLANQFGIENV